MNTQEPTNRELMHSIQDIKDDVAEIKGQTKLTNGRVGKLEDRDAFIRGGLAVLTVLFIPVLLMVIKILLEKK